MAALAAVGRMPRQGRAAAGTTTLLSVGISTFPANLCSWRLVRDTAPAFGTGESLERALGFVYASEGQLRLTADVANGSAHVFPSKAAFIPEAIVQRQESMDGSPSSYLRIGLVPPEDADYGAGGEVLFDSDAGSLRFAAPAGRRAIRLYRVDLEPNSEVPVPGGDAPVLLHVLDGQAGVGAAGGGDPTPLSAGRTVATGSDGQDRAVIRSGVGATLLLAVIGEEVPADGAGQIRIALFDCAGASGPCRDVPTWDDFSLALTGNGIALTQADFVSDHADAVWPDLPFGSYTLSLPNDYGLEVLPQDEGTVGPPDGNTQVYYPIALTPENPAVGIVLRRTE